MDQTGERDRILALMDQGRQHVEYLWSNLSRPYTIRRHAYTRLLWHTSDCPGGFELVRQVL